MRGDKIGVASRTLPATTAVATAAINALLAGPSPADSSAGLNTSIPTGTRLLGVSIANGTATVDLTGTFESGGGSLSMVGRLAQVTYTATQFPTVSRVNFRLDGKPVTVFGGEGIILDHPATRADFESVTPAILVEAPTPGTSISGQVRVWGTANVFEAAFRLQVTAPDGAVIVDRAVQATSGTGTRGTFDVTVDLAQAGARAATLTVYDLSAKDGSRQDVVAIPVRVA